MVHFNIPVAAAAAAPTGCSVCGGDAARQRALEAEVAELRKRVAELSRLAEENAELRRRLACCSRASASSASDPVSLAEAPSEAGAKLRVAEPDDLASAPPKQAAIDEVIEKSTAIHFKERFSEIMASTLAGA